MYKFHTLSFFCPFIFKNRLCILKVRKNKAWTVNPLHFTKEAGGYEDGIYDTCSRKSCF